MTIPTLENERIKLSPLTLDNYHHLITISQEKDLIYYSPSDISTPEKLYNYVEVANEGFQNKMAMPFIIYDKEKQQYAGSTRFGFIN